MHDAERRIAVGNARHEHARRANIHELIEGELLRLHLAPDAEDMLRAALDPRLDSRGAEFAQQLRLELFDVLLALRAARLECRGDALVIEGLQVAEREVLELPFDLPNAEPVGERRVDLACLDRKFALHGFDAALRGPHFLQLFRELDDDQSHIADNREQHLAQCLGLTRFQAPLGGPIRRQAELPELDQLTREPGLLGAEFALGDLPFD